MTTNLFKKTLVAAALAGASISAQAATVATTVIGISDEASLSANTIAINDIDVTLGAEYAVGDILTFTVNGAAASASTWPNTITVAEVAESGAGAGDGIVGLTLGRLSGTTSGATYRVTDLADTSVNSDSTSVGAVVSVTGVELRRNQAVEAGVVSVVYSAETQTGVTLDSTGTVTGELSVAGEEFAVALTNSNRLGNNGGRQIAIEFARRAFDDGLVTDDFSPALDQETNAFRDARDLVGVAFAQGSAIDEVTYTLNGDFSFVPDLDSPENSILASGTCSIDYNDATAVTATTIVATAAAAGTCTITLDLNDGLPGFAPAAIEPQAFTYSMVLDYTDGGAAYDGVNGASRTKTLAEDANAGVWLLNSFNTTIGYMPYGSGISQIIYLTNTGSTVGDIFVDAWTTDGTQVLDDVNVGSTTANGQTQLSQLIRTALNGAGVTSDRVRIRIVADIPAAQGRVFSAYNVSGDRLFTPNS